MRGTAGQLIGQALASAAALAARRHRARPAAGLQTPRAPARIAAAPVPGGEDGRQACPAAGGERRHHLACRTCGKTAAISEPALERWITAAGRERSLASLARHLFAACPDCGVSARPQPHRVRPHEGR